VTLSRRSIVHAFLKTGSGSISQFIISTCEAVTTTTERADVRAVCLIRFPVCPALRDVLQRLLRFVNQRQRSFPERVR
jgi:hypothetical protein